MRTATLLRALSASSALLLLPSLGAGCNAPTEEDTEDAEIGAELDELNVGKGDFYPANAIREIQGKIGRSSSTIDQYYKDNLRRSACYKNPAVDNLGWNNNQRLFYCSLPFELRICTSVKLVAYNARPKPISVSDVEAGMRGFLSCQREVDKVLPGEARQFDYSHNVNKTYQQLILIGKKGDKDDKAGIDQMNISISSKGFLSLAAEDALSLKKQLSDLGKNGRGFSDLVDRARQELKKAGYTHLT